MKLKHLGFDNWFQNRIDAGKTKDKGIARVIAVNKDSYLVSDGRREILGELAGKLMYGAESPLEYPTVGDWAYVQYVDNHEFCIIHDLFPRLTVLKRKNPGKQTEYQLIAANINTALIIQSLDGDYNPRRLERCLAMARESNIQPVVLLSKSDIPETGEVTGRISEITQNMPDIQILAYSVKSNTGLDDIRGLLTAGKTYCMIGSSGVGKTSLLNALLEETAFKTREVREKSGKGKHTTTRRQLAILQSGALMIDSPGMRELGNFAIDSGIADTFQEIESFVDKCRFNDCSHTREDGCAVLQALSDGKISDARYRNYMKMKKESAYYEQSYLEKKRKDKKFGKLCKSIIKGKRNKRMAYYDS